MRRPLKTTVFGIFTLLLVAGFQLQMASAQIGSDDEIVEDISIGYVIGPLTAIGDGDTGAEARSNALADLFDTLTTIEALLPEGEYVSGYEILEETRLPEGDIEIEFIVFIGIEEVGVIF